MEEIIKQFLSVSDGYGYGSGFGSGFGDGSGFGSGFGDGFGDGSGFGFGFGSGFGFGFGFGFGSGFGSGSGDGDGDGSGYGSGDDSGDDSNIPEFNGQKVYLIDGVATIIDEVRSNVAKGRILNKDFTLTPCWIAKEGNFFAHGNTLHEAVRDAMNKALEKSPIEERIAKFREQWPDADKKVAARSLWEWHHVLTGSCEAGRNAFARDHGIDLDNDLFTVREFVNLTANAYGADSIRKLADAYGIILEKI